MYCFNQASRTGGCTVEALAGPLIFDAARFVDLYHRFMAGDDVAAPAFRDALNAAPFVNLFDTRIALDYLLARACLEDNIDLLAVLTNSRSPDSGRW